MRKNRYLFLLVTTLLLFLFVGCEKVEDMGSLPDLSHPYAGEYTCKKLLLGGEDCLDRFDYVKLTLEYGGDFTLSYRDKEKRSGAYSGEYAVSSESDEITFSAKAGLKTVSRTFPVKNGTILIDLTFGQKLLHAEFSFPE